MIIISYFQIHQYDIYSSVRFNMVTETKTLWKWGFFPSFWERKWEDEYTKGDGKIWMNTCLQFCLVQMLPWGEPAFWIAAVRFSELSEEISMVSGKKAQW